MRVRVCVRACVRIYIYIYIVCVHFGCGIVIMGDNTTNITICKYYIFYLYLYFNPILTIKKQIIILINCQLFLVLSYVDPVS